jgi:hypothetical protein
MALDRGEIAAHFTGFALMEAPRLLLVAPHWSSIRPTKWS